MNRKEELEQPDTCSCYGRWECAACTLALLDAGRDDEARDTEISRSLRSLGITE